ncbi:GNAT family N-acetyltransferase [Erysipelothrix sp. D19-032]
MTNTVLVRPASMEDLATIHNLSRIELGYDYDFDTLQSTFRILRTDPNHKIQVAVLENVVVGFLHVNRYDSLLGPAMTNIMAIAVDQNYQGQGIGKIFAQCGGIMGARTTDSWYSLAIVRKPRQCTWFLSTQ